MIVRTRLAHLAFAALLSLCFSSTTLPQSRATTEQLSVVSTVAPKYPQIAQLARAKGNVVVEVAIDSRGDVVTSKMIEGHPLLRRVTEEASCMWKFKPTLDGMEMRSATITFSFDIQFVESIETSVVNNYVPPYRMEITRKFATISPLERINGQIPEEKCPLHGEIMKLDIVPINYGLPASTTVYNNDDVVNLFRNA